MLVIILFFVYGELLFVFINVIMDQTHILPHIFILRKKFVNMADELTHLQYYILWL